MLSPRSIALALAAGLLLASRSPAADRIVLSPQTWDDAAPQGKEVDAIYGDVVLRNDRLVAVVARAVPERNANMTVKNVGGCLIDLTTRATQSDQLSAYYPLGKAMAWQGEAAADQRDAAEVSHTLKAVSKPGQPSATLKYTLRNSLDYLLVETSLSNDGDKPLEVGPADEMRADGGGFQKAPNSNGKLFWVYDKWFGQAYGVAPESGEIDFASEGNNSTVRFGWDGKAKLSLKPGETLRIVRRIFPAHTPLELRGLVSDAAGVQHEELVLTTCDTGGTTVAGADLAVTKDGQPYATGRTDSVGRLAFLAPEGKYGAEVTAVGNGSLKLELGPGDNHAVFPPAGAVAAKISDERGGPIPCKVAFRGRDGTKDPVLGFDTSEHGVRNLYYSHNGSFVQPLEPGKYDVIVSHGPEYDAVFTTIEVARGKNTPLNATLKRSVDTAGWISSDFHSHSSPSGDNTSSQLGRVLNLLCEHIEFAPCTEHNRISTYDPHLAKLGVAKLMATCSGIELTGNPLPLNHQNAFPLALKERTQDGGGPLTDVNPEVQISRLALWDNRAEKLVQQNHPDLGNLLYDRDGDGKHDSGFAESLPFIDVVEVHPPHWILEGAFHVDKDNKKYNNTIFNWMQTLNQGRRIPGVVNTDAHYNFHGSGFLRIYIHSPTDDPAQLKTLDLVRESKKGHIVMTNGPFMQVSAKAERDGKEQTAICGDDLPAPSGKVALHVRVQCPNWFDINRVQVFVNGRPEAKLNFTRAMHSDQFGAGVIKFDRQIPLELATDAQVIVAAAGEKLGLGDVMGPDHGKDMPIVVSNPIFIDVDGGGFKANGYTLGAPLPVKDGTAK